MELIIINENKLKIIMTVQDMKDYGLDEDEFYCSVNDTRKIIERIIHTSKAKTGFENMSKKEKLLLQLYPEKDGGCELFVTRIGLDYGEDTVMDNEGNKGYIIPRKNTENTYTKNLAYSFNNLKSIITACKELKSMSFVGKSTLYKGNDKKYYLFIDEESKKNSSLSDLLSEFGEPEYAPEISVIMLEYGIPVIQSNAIERLSEL